MDVENEKSVPSLPQFQFAYPGIFYDKAVTVQYLIDKEILVIPFICPRCNFPNMKRRDVYMWQCTKKGCREGQSVMNGSFFSGNHNTGMVLLALHQWLSGASPETVQINTGLSDKTARSWRRHVQCLVMLDVQNMPEEDMMLGGPNWMGDNPEHSIIEIDESKFAKRKYALGHMVEGAWVVGLIERSRDGYKGKFVVERVDDRSAPTLEALILKYVRPGSCLYSDKWKGYRTITLADMDILHRTVNHTYNFKDPITGVHTNTIEGMWGHMKKVIPRQSRTNKGIEAYLWEFMWRRQHKGNLWNRLMHCLKVTRYDVDHEAVPPVPAVAPLNMQLAVVEHVVEDEVQEEEEVEHEEYIYENNLCNIC